MLSPMNSFSIPFNLSMKVHCLSAAEFKHSYLPHSMLSRQPLALQPLLLFLLPLHPFLVVQAFLVSSAFVNPTCVVSSSIRLPLSGELCSRKALPTLPRSQP